MSVEFVEEMLRLADMHKRRLIMDVRRAAFAITGDRRKANELALNLWRVAFPR